MDKRVFLLSNGLAAVMTVGSAAAGQHEGHQAGAAPSASQVIECRQAQPVITELLNAALKRLEDARLTNSAAAMRDAADDVQAALVDMRTQLAPCSVMQPAATEAHAGAATPAAPGAPATAGTPATQPSPAVPVVSAPHVGHAAPAAPPASAPRTPAVTSSRPPGNPQRPAAQPAATAARPTAPASDTHAGHAAPSASAPPAMPSAGSRTSAAAPPTNLAELKCSRAVDPKTAPRMLYQGRTYYFCTEASRTEFAKDPSKFVKTPPQAAPAHAH